MENVENSVIVTVQSKTNPQSQNGPYLVKHRDLHEFVETFSDPDSVIIVAQITVYQPNFEANENE